MPISASTCLGQEHLQPLTFQVPLHQRPNEIQPNTKKSFANTAHGFLWRKCAAAAMEEQCCHLQTLGIEASLFGKISPCTDVMLSCILSFITTPKGICGAHCTTGQGRKISNRALGSFMIHINGGCIMLSRFYGALQNWQNIVVRMRKFTFIKGIKAQLKLPYKKLNSTWHRKLHQRKSCTLINIPELF